MLVGGDSGHYRWQCVGNVLDAFSNYNSIIEYLDAENLVASYTAQKLEEKLKLHSKNE